MKIILKNKPFTIDLISNNTLECSYRGKMSDLNDLEYRVFDDIEFNDIEGNTWKLNRLSLSSASVTVTESGFDYNNLKLLFTFKKASIEHLNKLGFFN